MGIFMVETLNSWHSQPFSVVKSDLITRIGKYQVITAQCVSGN